MVVECVDVQRVPSRLMSASGPPSSDPPGSSGDDPSAGADELTPPRPDFGPTGYLPDRAARRARKIVLRAPLGIQWVVGALVVGVVVAVAGWFALRTFTPGPPFVEVPAEEVATLTEDGAALVRVGSLDVALVTVLGRSRAFDWSSPSTDLPLYCRESGLLESADGAAWRATGRGLDGTTSLVELPSVTVDGRLFVDPTAPLPPLAPDTESSAAGACGADV